MLHHLTYVICVCSVYFQNSIWKPHFSQLTEVMFWTHKLYLATVHIYSSVINANVTIFYNLTQANVRFRLNFNWILSLRKLNCIVNSEKLIRCSIIFEVIYEIIYHFIKSFMKSFSVVIPYVKYFNFERFSVFSLLFAWTCLTLSSR